MAPVPITGGILLGVTEPALFRCKSETVCPASCDVVPAIACDVKTKFPLLSALDGVRPPIPWMVSAKIVPTTDPTAAPGVPAALRTEFTPATPKAPEWGLPPMSEPICT